MDQSAWRAALTLGNLGGAGSRAVTNRPAERARRPS
jgi:hypothetical protein